VPSRRECEKSSSVILNPLYQAGINGAGQSIAIVARSDVFSIDFYDFMYIFGITPPSINYFVNGDDPGFVPGMM
jgi:subtilase family serine protease